MESIAVSDGIIGAAFEVHRILGSGLLDSAYEECLCYESSQRELGFRRQVPLPIVLTYLKAANKHVGPLMNFNEPVLKNGLDRVVNDAAELQSFSPRFSPRLRASAVKEKL